MKLISNNNINDASINLALEEFCVRNFDVENEMYLLFYINSPSIIIGKHQNTIEEINQKYVEENNIKVVRRISGGGAVYHDFGNLNFSFITKYSPEFFHNFEKFTLPVIETLNEMGINAVLGGRNDILVEGRKISGNAQFTNLKSMFSHGTLLFDSNLEDVVQALNVKVDKIESKGIKSIRSRVANINEFLNEDISMEQFKEKIVKNIFKDYEKLPIYFLSDEQWEEVEKLSNSKYRTWEWNYGRSPEFNIQKIKRFDFGQIDARINVKDGIIKNIKFFGDFLGYGDTEDLEKILIGIKYKTQDISDSIKEVNLDFYFGKININDFVNFIIN